MSKKPKNFYDTPLRRILIKEYQKLKKEKGLTRSQFAKMLGISNSFLSDILNGVAKGYNKIEQIAQRLNQPLTFFYKIDNILPIEIPEYHSRPIPVISWVQAGDFAEAIENWPVGVSGEGEPVFARKKVGPHAFGLRVKGDSMQPRYMEGDVIIVDPELDCESNCPCVAKLNDEVTFKLYYQNDKEIRLKALNDKYPDIVIDKDSRVDFKIIGKVVDMVPKL